MCRGGQAPVWHYFGALDLNNGFRDHWTLAFFSSQPPARHRQPAIYFYRGQNIFGQKRTWYRETVETFFHHNHHMWGLTVSSSAERGIMCDKIFGPDTLNVDMGDFVWNNTASCKCRIWNKVQLISVCCPSLHFWLVPNKIFWSWNWGAPIWWAVCSPYMQHPVYYIWSIVLQLFFKKWNSWQENFKLLSWESVKFISNNRSTEFYQNIA